MKKLNLLLLSLATLFISCSRIERPDNFVMLIMFTSDILDVEEMRITSKDELIEFVDTAESHYDYYYRERYYKGELKINTENYLFGYS